MSRFNGLTNILTQLVNLILGHLTQLKVQINFFPQKIIKHYSNQLIANMIIKIKTIVKENIFLKKKKKIVVVINNTLTNV